MSSSGGRYLWMALLPSVPMAGHYLHTIYTLSTQYLLSTQQYLHSVLVDIHAGGRSGWALSPHWALCLLLSYKHTPALLMFSDQTLIMSRQGTAILAVTI